MNIRLAGLTMIILKKGKKEGRRKKKIEREYVTVTHLLCSLIVR